jgi:uncharacterized protein
MSLEEIKKKILPILEKYHIRKAGIFGSSVTGQARPDSDIDILIEIPSDDISLLDFVRIKLELEDALNKKVDLVEYSTIKPLIRERILQEEVALL